MHNLLFSCVFFSAKRTCYRVRVLIGSVLCLFPVFLVRSKCWKPEGRVCKNSSTAGGDEKAEVGA